MEIEMLWRDRDKRIDLLKSFICINIIKIDFNCRVTYTKKNGESVYHNAWEKKLAREFIEVCKTLA